MRVPAHAVTLAVAASLAWGLADLLAGVWARRLPVRLVLAGSRQNNAVVVRPVEEIAPAATAFAPIASAG